jgi:MFS-type transporter involved in bile tolerance (Atg22 family)
MSSTGIIIFIMVNLIMNPFGVLIHRALARKIGHKRSYLMCVSYTTIITALMIGTIHSPKHSNMVYFFSALFGISFGWYYPSNNGYYVSLVPKEKAAELWGLNLFCSVILSWVPPIIFAVLNESTGNLRLGWIGVIVFEVIGVLIASTIPEKSDRDADVDASGGGDQEKGESAVAADTGV